MRSTLSFAALVAVLSSPALAQGRGAPPADHWMTIDSLVQAVGVTDAQKPEVTKHYDALNAVMKKAAGERAAWREQMGGERPSQEQMQQMRTRTEELQAEIEQHYMAIRNLLSAEQHEKFDALAKPRVTMGGRRGGR